MVFSKSQYPVDEATYVLVKEEKNGKIVGRFNKVKHRFIDSLGKIFLDYQAISKGEGKFFRMYLCDGRHVIGPYNRNVVKVEKGSVSLFRKTANKDYEEKVRSMIDEALRLPEE